MNLLRDLQLNPDGTPMAGTVEPGVWNIPAFDAGGYRCMCGEWVTNALLHHCNNPISVQGQTCPVCLQWTPNTVAHFCPGLVRYPTPAACHHCYCIDVPPSGERTKPHGRCCKCQDVRVKEQA